MERPNNDSYPILIVEDEKNMGQTLCLYLTNKGHPCLLAHNSEKARTHFYNASASPSIIIMDIGLPDGNGLELAREFRQSRKDFVLLFLSALNDPSTRVEGLEIGAHDFITKPFELKELTLRLERILKTQKSFGTIPEALHVGPLTIWFKKYEVEDAQGNILSLSQKECAILKLLYEQKNQVVSRNHIIENIWGENSFPSNRTVDNYIVKFRKWSDTDPSHTLQIVSIRSIGYKLVIRDS